MSISNLLSTVLGVVLALVFLFGTGIYLLNTSYGKALRLIIKITCKLVLYFIGLVVKTTRVFIFWLIPILLKKLNR